MKERGSKLAFLLPKGTNEKGTPLILPAGNLVQEDGHPTFPCHGIGIDNFSTCPSKTQPDLCAATVKPHSGVYVGLSMTSSKS